MPRLIVRPATKSDIEAFSSMANKPTVRAIVGEIDGKIIGLGGLALIKGRWFAFCDLTEEARAYKMTIARAAIRLMASARRDGIKFIYAEAAPDEPRALAWFASLGFTRDPRSDHFYRWCAGEFWRPEQLTDVRRLADV